MIDSNQLHREVLQVDLSGNNSFNQIKLFCMDTTKKVSEHFKITGSWDSKSKKLKAKYPQLTDTDLKFEPGKESELLSRLESRLKKTREEVISLIKSVELAKV